MIFANIHEAQKHHSRRNERILEYVGRVEVTAINAWD